MTSRNFATVAALDAGRGAGVVAASVVVVVVAAAGAGGLGTSPHFVGSTIGITSPPSHAAAPAPSAAAVGAGAGAAPSSRNSYLQYR